MNHFSKKLLFIYENKKDILHKKIKIELRHIPKTYLKDKYYHDLISKIGFDYTIIVDSSTLRSL